MSLNFLKIVASLIPRQAKFPTLVNFYYSKVKNFSLFLCGNFNESPYQLFNLSFSYFIVANLITFSYCNFLTIHIFFSLSDAIALYDNLESKGIFCLFYHAFLINSNDHISRFFHFCYIYHVFLIATIVYICHYDNSQSSNRLYHYYYSITLYRTSLFILIF